MKQVVTLYDAPTKELALGGAIEGAERTKRETLRWNAPMISPDQAINIAKPEADARTKDMVMNDGYSQHAVRIQKNGIVGSTYRLNAKPDYRVIFGEDTKLAADYGEELAAVAEARFNLAAESDDCWFDASGMMTFTDQVRLVVGSCVMAGEVIGTAEWDDTDTSRPFKTNIQMVSPDRLSNKDNMPDTRYLRRGVELDSKGRPTAFHIRLGHPAEWYDTLSNYWKIVPAAKPWGRRQVLFIREAIQIDQTRGLSDMVAALAHCRMTKKFSEITLQNAVVQASYAAAIESELPNHEVVAAMGGGTEGWQTAVGMYMSMLQAYISNADNIAIDGVKMPHLFPGTRLNMMPMGNPGGVGGDFESSLIRKIAATLGVSYSDLSRDLSKTSYSGLKGELALAERDLTVKKKTWADRWATGVYRLWFEEEMAAGNLPLPPGRNRTDFYRPLMKDAYTRCTWIGTGFGQIDELKETQAAMLRVKAGFSTFEEECAKLGRDYREVFAQRAKENALQKKLKLNFTLDATRDGQNTANQTIAGDNNGQSSQSGS